MKIVLLEVCFLTICVSGIDAVDHTNDELLERIKYLEEQGNKFAHTLEALESKIEVQNKQLENQQLRISDLEKDNAHLKQSQNHKTTEENIITNEFAHLLASLESKFELQNKQISKLKKENAELKNMLHGKTQEESVVNSLRPIRALEGDPVAFHAVIKNRQVDHIGIHQKIVFPDVILNAGGGYHNQHGLFIAPKSGIYLFSVSIMADGSASHHRIGVHLMKNGYILANAYGFGTGDADQGSVTLVTQLNVGDEVWVSLYIPADASLWGDSFDSFMGILVHETLTL